MWKRGPGGLGFFGVTSGPGSLLRARVGSPLAPGVDCWGAEPSAEQMAGTASVLSEFVEIVGSPHHETRLLGDDAGPGAAQEESSLRLASGPFSSRGGSSRVVDLADAQTGL